MWSSDEDSEEPARKIPRFKNRREYEEPQEFRERFRFTPLFEKLMTEIGEFLEPEHYGRHLHSLTSRQKLLRYDFTLPDIFTTLSAILRVIKSSTQQELLRKVWFVSLMQAHRY